MWHGGYAETKGGFVALTLYCFSPSFIQASAVWHTQPEIVAAWGAFGAIFTAIAVAHTLYARVKLCCGTGGALCCWEFHSRSRWDRSFR